ncbi:MAG: hypothetical protein NVSMB56_12340 [Pyrinomonadaceae bacterium]
MFVALLALVCAGAAAHRMDKHPASAKAEADRMANEEIYISPNNARRLSLCFNGLAADWYWMRTLQYVGQKILNAGGKVNIDDLSGVDLKLLASLLDHTTTLDPNFMAAYQYGAVVLPAVDMDAAIKLLDKGINANPQAWRLYQHLGYIHWQREQYAEASAAYEKGAQIPGAPVWMRQMQAQMESAGGSRQTARAIYEQMYREADDEQIKTLAAKRLAQLQSLDERDTLRQALNDFHTRNNRCATVWRELSTHLRAAHFRLNANGAPLDPTGFEYVLKTETCDVELGAGSEIPRK